MCLLLINRCICSTELINRTTQCVFVFDNKPPLSHNLLAATPSVEFWAQKTFWLNLLVGVRVASVLEETVASVFHLSSHAWTLTANKQLGSFTNLHVLNVKLYFAFSAFWSSRLVAGKCSGFKQQGWKVQRLFAKSMNTESDYNSRYLEWQTHSLRVVC